MKNRLSYLAVIENALMALFCGAVASLTVGANPGIVAFIIFALGTGLQFIKPFNLSTGKLMEGLQKEIWIPEIQENPIPDTSFVYASTDKSEFVENNKLHLAEAGVEPGVHEDYFAGNEDELPTATVADIPHEVVLKTYSTEQTRHRDLQEIELSYNRKMSVINRHKSSLAKNIGKRAAFAWTPSATNGFNKLFNLAADDSVIDAIIDAQAFYGNFDLENLNICLPPDLLARIRKEDKKLYKEIFSDPDALLYGFKPFRYSQTSLFTGAGVKKPFGSVVEAGDRRCAFTWATDETFRCFGDTKMYDKLGDPGLQADVLSFAQRALVGNIRATSPKFLTAIF